MATINQIRGMLLEEAVLQLLRTAGYDVVDSAGNDPTLHEGRSGMEIVGRGCWHQADALADFNVNPPFSNPNRLIVEAKCYQLNKPVCLSVVRGCVGVLKDVSEWWFPSTSVQDTASKGRFHYQYAVFSASGFTREAERYAFAQDIYLIPYQNSRFISNMIDSIRKVSHIDFGAESDDKINIRLSELRRNVRAALQTRGDFELRNFSEYASETIGSFLNEVWNIRGTLIAMAGRRFPIHLIPSPSINIVELLPHYDVRIYYDEVFWYLRDAHTGENLFSFDIPPQLFNLYAEHGHLAESSALNLKSEMLNRMQAVLATERETRLITFKLDAQWINYLKDQLQRFSKL